MSHYYDKYPDPTLKTVMYILGIIICLVIIWRAVVH